MAYNHLHILIAIIRLYMQNLTFKFISQYKHANTEYIKRAIEKFNWQRDFLNTSVSEKVVIFNKTVLNIFNNFIPHETIVCDDKDPPRFNNKIKTLIQAKKRQL